jgi:hypothetical protein
MILLKVIVEGYDSTLRGESDALDTGLELDMNSG